MPKVVIDGIEYVPASEALPDRERLIAALLLSYMGKGYREFNNPEALENLEDNVYVTMSQSPMTDDRHTETLRAFCTRITQTDLPIS